MYKKKGISTKEKMIKGIKMRTTKRSLASIKLASGNIARHASRYFLYGDIRLAMQIKPASAKSFATSPTLDAQKVVNNSNKIHHRRTVPKAQLGLYQNKS